MAAGFEPVRDAFERALGGRGGAAFAAWAGNAPLADLWGGDAAAGAAWRKDTLQLVFSGTKGLTAACVLVLVDRGELSLDEPVGRYWPDFAGAGKSEITVAELLSHRAGLAAPEGELTLADLLDPDAMAARLARQEPYVVPGRPLAYHALSFGWLCHGLVRSVTGSSVGVLFRETFADPLGLDLWIGLPAGEEERVSVLTHDEFPVGEPLRQADYACNIYCGVFGDAFPWNDRRWHAAEVPAANAIGTARSLARFYAALPELLSAEALQCAGRQLSGGLDAFFDAPFAFSCGFELQARDFARFGPLDGAFGHTGAGGSIHGRWPRFDIGFSFCVSDMRDEQADDRGRSILRALADCVHEQVAA